jgi:hypothetical protein
MTAWERLTLYVASTSGTTAAAWFFLENKERWLALMAIIISIVYFGFAMKAGFRFASGKA